MTNSLSALNQLAQKLFLWWIIGERSWSNATAIASKRLKKSKFCCFCIIVSNRACCYIPHAQHAYFAFLVTIQLLPKLYSHFSHLPWALITCLSPHVVWIMWKVFINRIKLLSISSKHTCLLVWVVYVSGKVSSESWMMITWVAGILFSFPPI